MSIPAIANPDLRGYANGVTGGGNAGTRVYVTTLADNGHASVVAGSLRDAIYNAEGPKIIDFSQIAVSGYLTLADPILFNVNASNMTIDGATAPEGVNIVIRMAATSAGSLFDIDARRTEGTQNVLLRHLRFAHGAENAGALNSSLAIKLYGGRDILIDHCSFRWSEDNLIGIYRGEWGTTEQMFNIGITNCIFAESFGSHATGVNVQENRDDLAVNPKTRSRFGNLTGITLARNLFVGVGWRAPQAVANGVEMVNNITHNHGQYVCQTKDDSVIDLVGNYISQGPRWGSDKNDNRYFHFDQNGYVSAGFVPSIHLSENYFDQGSQAFDGRGVDNWPLLSDSDTLAPVNVAYKRASRMVSSNIGDGDILDPLVLAQTLPVSVGATIPQRDGVDRRLIAEFAKRVGHDSQPAGIGDTPEGGWPTL